jgi:hypothetical protein
MKARAIIRCAAAAALIVLVWQGCSRYPVDTSGRDLPELESVWQYLTTYSIWQDSIPLAQDPFAFSTPEQLLASVNDTLHSPANYTIYDSTHLPRNGTVSAVSAGTADSAVHLFRETNSTVRLQITGFKEDTTYPAFKNGVPLLAQYANIIVDLRNNGGGSIDAVDSIIEYFLPVNTPYIRASYRRYNSDSRTAETVPWEQWITKHAHTPSLAGKRLAVLINGGSASASEILAAGLKDGRTLATTGDTTLLVGETSYGKGMGQIIVSRTYLGKRDIMITFLRLKGLSARTGEYHRKGIAPDVRVQSTDFLAPINTALHVLEPSAPLLKRSVEPPPVSCISGAYRRTDVIPAYEK